ncbi:MAG: FlgD immunoglobulin-like domain containing protein, partial [Candidatus Eiseniibacteriota bacterium]
RAFFGDPYVFDPDGTLDLWTPEGFPMGRVVLTDRSSHQVIVEIDGLPSTSTVRFLQGEIRDDPPVEYIDPNYLRDEMFSGTWSGTTFTDTVTVDTTVPSFVRVEVDDQGTATAYSNWLAFVTEVPSLGVKGPRVAAVLGQAKVVRADEFTLTGMSYTEGAPSILTVQGDEEAAGLGTLEIDTGTLGAPTSVSGGGFTSTTYQNGLLTLVGLSGSGSTVAVEWGGTGAFVPAGRVDRLSLSVGRPNPFGGGTMAEFALPRPSTVFLEVLDVKGRRVRLLLDERRETGSHRVSWDGKDSGGRSVANGVYFLRLTAMGETLTTKAVRIR